jgi:small subunit ribosomal protein S11
MASPRRGGRKEKKNVPEGIVHIRSTFNNTIINITDKQGTTISWSSAGTRGFKGSRKGTPFAAQVAAENAVRKAADHGMRSVEVHLKGPGSGREAAVRALQIAGFKISVIRDVTRL